MSRRRLGLSLVVAVGFGVVSMSFGGSSTPEAHRLRLQPIAAAANHAAVVIDTGKEVRKFCLAFPEDEITGAEALRRIDVSVEFANFGSRGQAVCSLNGTGCPSSNCFCDPNRFWAYHRAGPGGAPYAFSRTGASGTSVRNGDVEGWKWGAGEAPPAAKVSDVCNVAEPPARTAGAAPTTSMSTTATSSQEPQGATTTSGAPVASAGTPPTTAPTSGAVASQAPGSASSDVTEPGPPSTSAATTESAPPLVEEELVDPSGVDVGPGMQTQTEAAAPTREQPESGSSSSRGAAVVFAALLGGVLAWRTRLKRAKVRPDPPVR